MKFFEIFWWFLGGDRTSKELIDSQLSSCKEQKHTDELQENTDFSADDELDFDGEGDFFE